MKATKPRLSSMSSVRVSAVVPNFNHGRFIDDAIAALLAQSRPFDEIIVVDDGSSDDSRERIERWILRNPIVRAVWHSKNHGAIAALNAGLRAATGDFIYFGAADDVVKPNLLTDTLAPFEHYRTVAFVCAEVVVLERSGGQIRGLRPIARPSSEVRAFTADQTKALLRRIDFWIVTNASLFRRDYILDVEGFDPRLGSFADSYLARRLALRNGFCFVPKVVAEWRIEQTGYSQTVARSPERVLTLLDEVKRACAADPLIPQWYPDLFERRLRAAVGRIAISGKAVDWPTLRQICATNVRANQVLDLVEVLPRQLHKPALAAFLALRFHPMSVFAVLKTKILRAFE